MLEACKEACTLQTVPLPFVPAPPAFADVEALDIDGAVVSFGELAGRVVLVTNVASFCGRTESHYRELSVKTRNAPSSFFSTANFSFSAPRALCLSLSHTHSLENPQINHKQAGVA